MSATLWGWTCVIGGTIMIGVGGLLTTLGWAFIAAGVRDFLLLGFMSISPFPNTESVSGAALAAQPRCWTDLR